MTIRLQDSGFVLEHDGEGNSDVVEFGQWYKAPGWQMRIMQAVDADDTLLMDNPSWGAPEIVYVKEEDGARRQMRYQLPTEDGLEVLVGRNLSMDVVLTDEWVSEKHARIYVKKGKVLVEDTHSRHGTKLNGQPLLQPTELKHGDELRMGSTKIRYVCYTDMLANLGQSKSPAGAVVDTAPVPTPTKSEPPQQPQAASPKPAAAPDVVTETSRGLFRLDYFGAVFLILVLIVLMAVLFWVYMT
ncbi:MAG: FHA domain-containing protein [Tepidisphaeraceae bacterium]